jgi:hypothetical protein
MGGSRCSGGHPRHGGICYRDFCPGGCYSVGQRHPPCQGCRRLGRPGGEGGKEKVSRGEAENAVAIASAHEDADGFVRKIALLEGKLMLEHRTREVSERECQDQFEELTLLQARGSKLCHTIVGPPQARHHLSEGMRLAALHHTEMAGELAVLWAAVSSAVESVLGRSPNDTFHMEVVGDLVAKFQKLEEWHSRLEWPTMQICGRLLGLPPSQP